MKRVVIPIKELPSDTRRIVLQLSNGFKRFSSKDKKMIEKRCNGALGKAILNAVNNFYKDLYYTYEENGIKGVLELLGGNDDEDQTFRNSD